MSFILFLTFGGVILAQKNNSFNYLVSSIVDPTPSPTPQISRPKRRNPSPRGNVGARMIPQSVISDPVLASAEFNLIGLSVTANPVSQTVPKNTPTAILTSVNLPQGADPTQVLSQLNTNFRVRGELVGPSFSSPRVIEAPIGENLVIPPLSTVGDHVIQNLRVVDIGTEGQPTIAPVNPDTCGIQVIDQIFISQVQVREMSYQEIISSGISLSDQNYKFYDFVLGLGTSSGVVPIKIPVALPEIPNLKAPVLGQINDLGVTGISVPQAVAPFILKGVKTDGSGEEEEIEGIDGKPITIPGAVVFPGQIGLLNQFFEANVIVSNGAPNGTPLVISNLKAKAKLPDAGTPGNPNDDPLRFASMQNGQQLSEMPLHGLGDDNKYGTSDDTFEFAPGQSGQGAFFIEGLKEGTHVIDFDLEGTLNGLPAGPVTVRGKVQGIVLVKDASFSVTFTHPSVVRAGQEYDLGLTIYNSGSRDIQNILARLNSNSISGAELLDTPEKSVTSVITQGDSTTVKWRLRAMTTGQVTASYVKVGEGVESGLNLITGVGDRNIPLSPDSLILPDNVNNLPPSVVEAGRQLLGQAWGVANAPLGSLPSNVVPMTRQTVISKAIEFGVAGLRVKFGEPQDVALKTLLRDWLGEEQNSTGFADTLKDTPAGDYFYDSVGTHFFGVLNSGQDNNIFSQLLAESESPRSNFISVLATQNNGSSIFGAKLISPENKSIGWGDNIDARFGEIRTGLGIHLFESDPYAQSNQTKGQFLLVSKPVTGDWKLELTGWQNGFSTVSVLVPIGNRIYQQLNYNFEFQQGKKYRITFKVLSSALPIVEEFNGSSYQIVPITPGVNTLNEALPRAVSAIQVTPEIIEGGDPYGRLVGILYSKPMIKNSVETEARYQISNGIINGSNPVQPFGGEIKVVDSIQNFGNRFVILALDNPVGSYINRNLSINGVFDTSNKQLATSSQPIQMRVSPMGNPPGAFISGTVRSADGTVIPNAIVSYSITPPKSSGGCQGATSTIIAQTKSDFEGKFYFDYVRESPCSNPTITSVNPATNSVKSLSSKILFNGQHIVFDVTYLARGKVRGTVFNNGVPLANADVSITPELDVINRKIVRTNQSGYYEADDIPVGIITVKAVGTGNYSLSSGIAVGTIPDANQTATIDVNTQNVSGKISGRVISLSNQMPENGALVIARAVIPGFTQSNKPIPVGYSYTDQSGQFLIDNLPIGDVFLTAYNEGSSSVSTTVSLIPTNPHIEGVLIGLKQIGFGSINGRVIDETGQPIAGINVINNSANNGTATFNAVTDNLGQFSFPRITEGNFSLTANVPAGNMTGSISGTILENEVRNNVDIVVRRPATLRGQVFVVDNGIQTPVPDATVIVGTSSYKTLTDSQGRYEINNIPSGENTIRFIDTRRSLFINLPTAIIPGETLNRNAVFRPSRIYGRVTQPDGAGAVAMVTLKSQIPYLTGDQMGLPNREASIQVQSDANGNYSIPNVNPGDYSISVSSPFFPTKVSSLGFLPNSYEKEVNLTLVDTISGKIKGRIYQPDGVTPVGGGVKVSIGTSGLGNITIQTNPAGYYEFPEVIADGTYSLTATDPVSGLSNQTYISAKTNKEVIADLRLLGKGNLRVRVVDGAGQPIQSGFIDVQGNNYPKDKRNAEVVPINNGTIQFNDLTEGNYSVFAANTYLKGRGSATVVVNGTTEIIVQIQASGRVTGKVFMPDEITPVGLADVKIISGGRVVGISSSSDSEEERGSFIFDGIVEGDYSIEVFDNRSGRYGISYGRISQQDETVNTNVKLQPRGTVTGRVTLNGNPVEHSLVRINASGSGIGSTSVTATTDSQGIYQFVGIPIGRVYLQAGNGPGGTSGFATGTVSGTTEPLPNTVIDIPLTSTATVKGKVYKSNGVEPFAGAKVNVSVGYFNLETISNEFGDYQLNYVPLGTAKVTVSIPGAYERGRSELPLTQAGGVYDLDVILQGVGNVTGTGLDNNGVPLNKGTVTLTNTDWDRPLSFVTSVQSDGRYLFMNVPKGEFSLKLTVPDRAGAGSATGNLAPNQTLDVPLQMQAAGRIIGRVVLPDGTTPAIGADVKLQVRLQNNTNLIFVVHSDSNGNWVFDNIPLGIGTISISEPNSGGLGYLPNIALENNAQIIDTGVTVLDNRLLSVEEVIPSSNASNIAPTSPIQLTFNQVLNPSTVTPQNIRIEQDGTVVPSNLAVSEDGKKVNIIPNNPLQGSKITSIIVTTGLRNVNGLGLIAEFRSTFTTVDNVPPSVTNITPPSGSVEVPLNAPIIVKVSEPLSPNQNFVNTIRINSGEEPVAGNISIDETGTILTFIPVGLNESRNYTVTVSGLKDLDGNIQTNNFTSNFKTRDITPPIVNPLPIDGTTVRTFTPTITATFSDNFSGINQDSLIFTLDGVNVTSQATITSGNLSFTPTALLSQGQHTVTLQVSDNAGNVSQVRSATFLIDNSVPIITSFTVDGIPIANGMQISSSLTPVFEIHYVDNNGIRPDTTQLLLGTSASNLTPVSASVSNDKLIYQPASPLIEGNYIVQAIITSNTGASVTTEQYNFTLNPNAPFIGSIEPNHGNQWGRTTVNLRGLKLLNTNGSAPTVLVGGNPAIIAQTTAGTGGNPDIVTIITPQGFPGSANVEITTDRGLGRAINGFTYDVDSNAPFNVESDTVMLWRLDETGNGAGIQINDASSLNLFGTTGSSTSISAEGRFGGGRSYSNASGGVIQSRNANGGLDFGMQSFTMEMWIKTPPVTQQRGFLMGLYSGVWGVNLILENSGTLSFNLLSANNTSWRTATNTSNATVTDNNWHLVTAVVNQAEGKLSLYVDGELQSETIRPSGFDGLRSGNIFYSYQYQNLILDELRISSGAFSPQRVFESFHGSNEFKVATLDKTNLVRNSVGVQSQDILVNGSSLENISAQIIKNGQPLNVNVNVVSSYNRSAKINVSIPPNTPLGLAQLIISKPNSQSISKDIIILENRQFVKDQHTVMLWHLDEQGNGAGIQINDASSLNLFGTTGSSTSISAEGRFGGGRSYSNASGGVIQSRNANGGLDFGMQSFTMEMWIKTPPVTQRRANLMSLYGGGVFGVNLNLETSGTLSFNLLSANATSWTVQQNQSGSNQGKAVDDNKWHLVTAVVNQGEGKLSLYVDGELQAETMRPPGFDGLRGGNIFYSHQYQNLILDELRVSSGAFSPQRIAELYYGTNEFRVYHATPQIAQAGQTTRIVIEGENLSDVSISSLRGEININPISISSTQVVLDVTPAPSSLIGDAQIILTKPTNEILNTTIKIVNQQPFLPHEGTLMLWHLDEPGNGAGIQINDASSLNLFGTTGSSTSISAEGRFGGGRSYSNASGGVIQSRNANGGLDFGMQSFTMEMWIKTPPVTQQRGFLMGLYSGGWGVNLVLENSGTLSFNLLSANNTSWTVQPNQSGSNRGKAVDDNKWHLVTAVVNQGEGKLSLYVDGELQAETMRPPGFDGLRGGNIFYSYQYQNLILDEMRILNYALQPFEITNTWTGSSFTGNLLKKDQDRSIEEEKAERVAQDLDSEDGKKESFSKEKSPKSSGKYALKNTEK